MWSIDRCHHSVYCQSHRSCNGAASPTSQGSKSVRDFEEQTAALHKEIFNLKLKLFFMEESMPCYKQTQANGQDPLLKQLVDKKVEVEMMRKELLDNQQLLREGMDTINDLQTMISAREQKYQEDIEVLNHKISLFEMERELQQESKCLLEHVQSTANANNANATQQIEELQSKLKEADEKIEEFQSQISELDEILVARDEKIRNLEAQIDELKQQNANHMARLQQQTNEIESLGKLSEEVRELKLQMADKMCQLDETEDKLKQKSQVYEKALKTIQKLMLNIRTQEKEIEKLKSHNKNTANNNTMPLKNALQMTGVSALEGLEVSGLHQKTVDESGDVGRRQSFGSQEMAVAELKKQLQQARNDVENSDRWRKECADVCGVLTNRLEELAGFLNSLLRQKDVLGVLAADRRKAMRKAVDRSLDLSKSLNMTLSISGLSLNDISLAHLSNLSQILGYNEDEEAEVGDLSRTGNSFNENSRLSFELMKHEKLQMKKMETSGGDKEKRKALAGSEMKKERKSLLLAQENQSESEAWSEPDRLVSMARIGLEEHSTSLSKETSGGNKKMLSSESDCEREALNTSRSCLKSQAKLQEKVMQLEKGIQERDERLLDIQCQLVEADNRLKKENLRVLEMTNRIEALEQRNDELQQEIDTLSIQMEAKEAQLNQAELMKEIEEKSVELAQLKVELDEAKLKHEIALTCANEELKEKLEAQKEQLEAVQEKHLKEMEFKHKCELERDYVALMQYEEVKAQLLALQRQYMEAQRTIDNISENEHELKQTLNEMELEARALKKQLDESTLQASKAILDRTKAFNEKLQYEKQFDELKLQLEAFASERNTLNEHIQRLEEQAAAYEALKLQHEAALKERQTGEEASGYTSEEVPNPNNANNMNNNNGNESGSSKAMLQRVIKRQNNSSSPDLGIESDAGRLSGPEGRAILKVERKKEEKISNIQEDLENGNENIDPLLQTQTTEAATTSSSQQIQHDCAKVEHENQELRRKLYRTKQAFEDTYEKLRIANQRKAQIEKDIKNQILKTHNVLRNVRTNMENEL